jgi:hypothetical protein
MVARGRGNCGGGLPRPDVPPARYRFARRLDERRAEAARSIPKSRPDRLREAKRRLEEEHQVECRANADYEAYRARGVMKDGRRFGRPPDPFEPPPAPTGKINLSDLDSRNVKTSRGWVQGYNAQLVTTEDQIVIAAEVNVDSPDFGHLEPMVTAARGELERAGIDASPELVLADAGYWHHIQMERLVCDGMAGLGPARRQETRRITAGLGRRTLRVHAPRPRHRARRRALRQAPGDGRAGVRRHQVQPPHRPISPPRQGRRQIRMAPDQRRPQPAQAVAPHHRDRGLRAAAPRRAGLLTGSSASAGTQNMQRRGFRNSLRESRLRR